MNFGPRATSVIFRLRDSFGLVLGLKTACKVAPIGQNNVCLAAPLQQVPI